jgi:hypothetical protein
MSLKKGQISIEYLILVGFITFAIIGILATSVFYSSAIRDRIKFNQLNAFAEKIIRSSEGVFYAGEPSKITITAYLPNGITGIEVLEKDIIFDISTESGDTKIAYSANVVMEGEINPSEGVKRISIFAGVDRVYLNVE